MTYTIHSSIEIHLLKNLYKFKYLHENSNLEVNQSQIARDLNVDRRTIRKYINGCVKPAARYKSSYIGEYYDLVKELFSFYNTQVFF